MQKSDAKTRPKSKGGSSAKKTPNYMQPIRHIKRPSNTLLDDLAKFEAAKLNVQPTWKLNTSYLLTMT